MAAAHDQVLITRNTSSCDIMYGPVVRCWLIRLTNKHSLAMRVRSSVLQSEKVDPGKVQSSQKYFIAYLLNTNCQTWTNNILVLLHRSYGLFLCVIDKITRYI